MMVADTVDLTLATMSDRLKNLVAISNALAR